MGSMNKLTKLRLEALFLLAANWQLSPATAQDLVAAAPALVKIEHQDPRVRVLRLRMPENGSLPTHERPRGVVVSLKANHVRLVRSDGTESEMRSEAGSFAWTEPVVGSWLNLGSAVEDIVVELRQAGLPGETVASPPAGIPAKYLSESRHRWSMENQYVRVYDVRIPPGETTTFHRHAYDQVAIYVSGGLVSDQLEGQAWGEPETVAPGEVEYLADASQPITHRVRNDGKSEYHVVLVQFLQ